MITMPTARPTASLSLPAPGKVRDKLMSAYEASFILRYKLGPERAWDDLLADMRRGRATYLGLTLLPYGRRHDGRAKRPLYLLSDVLQFVADALALRSAPPDRRLKVEEVEVDRSDRRHWSVRVLCATRCELLN